MVIPFKKPDFKLEDQRVMLTLLESDHLESLTKVAAHPDIWQFFTSVLSEKDNLKKWVEIAIMQKEQYQALPFVIFDKLTGIIAGSTRLGNISIFDKRAEIGWTWLGKEFQGTGLNKHCKLLLLQYAFEELGFERIEFKTDELNLRSRAALEKIGAKQEGILRSHMLMPGNRRRNSVYFSIIKEEWPLIKANLLKN
jgi:N-acetyltransferase